MWAAAAREPLVVVLDDLHAADESSLVLLNLVARDVRGQAVLVVGCGDEQAARAMESMVAVARRRRVALP